MKTLLIMRHAKSNWNNTLLADHDRPLNERGERDAPAMGSLLLTRGLVPELIITSTAERARRTAALVAERSAYEGEIVPDKNLYHAGVDEFIEGLQQHPKEEDIVMIVGHNPGVSELVDFLTDQPEPLTTGDIAVIRLHVADWRELDFETEGDLVEVLRPGEAGG